MKIWGFIHQIGMVTYTTNQVEFRRATRRANGSAPPSIASPVVSATESAAKQHHEFYLTDPSGFGSNLVVTAPFFQSLMSFQG